MELLTEYTARQLVRDQAVLSQRPHPRQGGHPRPTRTLRKIASRVGKR
jgi:ribosomal protein L4